MAEFITKEKQEDVNEFHFIGVLTGKIRNDRASTIFMRMTTRHGSRTFTNFPAIHIFDEELRNLIENIPTRSLISVNGYITSKKQAPEDRQRALQSFVMTECEVLEDEKTPHKNEITILGNVYRAYVARGRNVNFILVSFREGYYMKRIKVEAFPKKDVNYMEFMAAGTRLKVTAHCSTRSEDTTQGRRYYEYIVADSIETA